MGYYVCASGGQLDQWFDDYHSAAAYCGWLDRLEVNYVVIDCLTNEPVV